MVRMLIPAHQRFRASAVCSSMGARRQANVLTGVVNLTFQTLSFSDMNAYLVIVVYMLNVCAVAGLLHAAQVTIKTW